MGRTWMSMPLERKVKSISTWAAVIVILSIAANVMVAGYGMKSFSSILKSNSQSLAFWSAMDEESLAFRCYVEDETEENYRRLQNACLGSKRRLKELPFDYQKTGANRYARTWSLLNMYENYERERDGFLEMKEGEAGYLDQLYLVYRIQGYLNTRAGQLEQMTVEMGNSAYESHKYWLVVVPSLTILLGEVSLLFMKRLRCSVGRYIVQPVLDLAEDSRRIAENDFSGPDTCARGEDEIAQLVRAFCTMKASTRGYIEALKKTHAMEQKLNEVRLQMLKNQINPHFLFNTLNMIASTAQIEDAASTEKMITALSRLFRYNLKSSDSVMPLDRELNIVQDYMYLQKMRFGARIRYSIDCAPDTLEVLVPSFALQPLVENAIKHGLSSKSQGGRIHIRSRMEGTKLKLWVSDTGTGISEERLREIRKALEREDDKKTGIGISNIYRRIHGMYQDGEMFLYSREGCGTSVVLSFTAGERVE